MNSTKTRPITGLLSLALLTAGCMSLAAEQRPQDVGRYAPMSGVYELERSRGGDPERAAEAATRSLPPGQRDRAYRSLLDRLDPPQILSLDRVGRTVTIASSRGPRSAFEADGRGRRERGPDDRMITTRADISGARLTVSTSGGSRGSDFSVTFESLDGGDGLLVTRRLDDDDLRRPITIESYYRRTAPTPRWDVYTAGPGYADRGGNMMVPDGTRLVATLDTPLSMRSSRDGERFTMTVRSPAQFQGARIDGVVTRTRDRRTSGVADIRIDFQSIERDGRSFEFDAWLNTVRLYDGTVLRVNPDGDVREVRPNDTAVQNGAIGAAVGAVIGALTGGGKGAVVGAVVGGAGGVILSQGHEQLDLPPGTDVTLTAITGYRGR